MTNANENKPGNEDSDLNNSEFHDPVESGKKAIEAERVTNENDKPEDQQSKEEKEDAEKWRNEG